MKRALGFFLLGLLGCGSPQQGSVAGGPDASSDALVTSEASSDAPGNACTAAIDAVLASGNCTRCWPATRALCTKGRADVVQGITACLTANGVCWDLFDPNTAGPCMQGIIDANADALVKSVQAKRTALGCPSWDVLGSGALAAMMSDADRVQFTNCGALITTCDTNALTACLSGTAFDASLCKN